MFDGCDFFSQHAREGFQSVEAVVWEEGLKGKENSEEPYGVRKKSRIKGFLKRPVFI